MKGFDTAATTTPYINDLWDAGHRVAFRYLTRSPTDWRQLKAPEVKALHEKGFLIGLYFQHVMTQQQMLASASRAKTNAFASVARARELGVPKGTVIFHAVDCDVTPAYYSHLVLYFEEVKKIVEGAGYRLGCYGDDDVATVLYRNGIIEAYHAVKTNARAWSPRNEFKDWGAYQGLPYTFFPGFQIDPLTVDPRLAQSGALWAPPGEEMASGGGILEFFTRLFGGLFRRG